MTAGLFYHDVLRALGEAGVEYVVVGGLAVNLQGVPRFTADLDIVVAMRADNLEATARALTGLGLVPRLPVPAGHLADLERVRDWIETRNLVAFTFHDPSKPLREVDVLLTSPVPFEEIQESAETMEAAGLTIRVASRPVLIAMKSATGRAQDASDADALRRILGLTDDDQED